MAYVITQRCCNDASCVAVCPVDCIRPGSGDPEFATAEQVYIDPDTCIDCGACALACPVDAIFSEDDLTSPLKRFGAINTEYFRRHPLQPNLTTRPVSAARASDADTLRVAIVGAGPAASYAAAELISRGDVEVDLFDRTPTPGGLIRSGVAPDHAETKKVSEMLESAMGAGEVAYHLNVEVGRHLSHDELLAHHHAVIYAVGASRDRRLNIPGEDLSGSHSATEFVGWYNGHPDFADRTFDLSGERAVIVGNGNVALDVARVLTADPDELARTDIADHALRTLRQSAIREVVILGRRGPLQAAYTSPEFMALGYLNNVDVVIDAEDLELDPESQRLLADPVTEPSVLLKHQLAQEYSMRIPDESRKRIVFKYLTSPTAITGGARVDTLEFVRNELTSTAGQVAAKATNRTGALSTGLVLRSVGYTGEPVADLPFDETSGIVPNERGRVIVDDAVMPGVYVSGWIKRGARGVIGTNRVDAEETVEMVIADYTEGRLVAPRGDRATLEQLLAHRQPQRVDFSGWKSIDANERSAGESLARPRVKIASRDELLEVARG